MARSGESVKPLAVPRRGARELNDRVYKWILLLPAVVVVLGLSIFPMLVTLTASFTDWHLFNKDAPINFVGPANWITVFTSPFFLITARNTIVFMVLAVPCEYLIGLTVALALNYATVGQKFFRVFFLMPLMISPIAVSVVIGRMFFNEDIGPLNDLLYRAGLPTVRWLTDPAIAMLSIVAIDVWQTTAFMVIMLLAGLQSLPQEPYEAAIVDGASTWQRFRYITFPLLVPYSVTAVLIRGLDAFKVVDIIRVVTGGGPGQATESVTLAVYDLGVKGGDIAQGSAAAYGLLIIMMSFAGLFLLLTRGAVKRAT